jgi:ribosome-associated toxin RatA of RatAB toxin-antitoxin module
MRTVSFSARVPRLEPGAILARLADFERYPDYTDTVIDVVTRQRGPAKTESEWEVKFREGILKWVEEEILDADLGTIAFKAVGGDLERFEGSWTVTADGATTQVDLHIEFDAGLGTLSEVVEPIAERTLRENFEIVLRALMGSEGLELVE